jgi:hypothetical protein
VARDATHGAADRGRGEDGRREQQADRGAGGDAPPGAVPGGGLVLVLVHLALGVLGDHGGVVRTDQSLGVEILDDLVVGPGGGLVRVGRDVDERAVGLGHGSLLLRW